mgnify:CR=1 FL=1
MRYNISINNTYSRNFINEIQINILQDKTAVTFLVWS